MIRFHDSTRPSGGRRRKRATQDLRLGLCCQLKDVKIRFRTTTATSLMRLKRIDQLRKLSDLCLSNAESLFASFRFCDEHSIGCFRVISSILPLKTHPQVGYRLEELPDAATIVERFEQCGNFARAKSIRTVFHPDQFVVLNSPRADVVARAIQDLEYHAEVAEWIGVDVINIHGGGAYQNNAAALATFATNLDRLSDRVRTRLTIENDDKVFTPSDLLPICRSTGLPLVYDVHHHRCLPDGLSIEEATAAAIQTWNREPLFHISSPLAGWDCPQPERHHDFIDIEDFPLAWVDLPITVEVEAKAKEIALLRLREQLNQRVVGSLSPRSSTIASRP